MLMTAVPISIFLVRAPTAARSGKGGAELSREVVNAEVRVRAKLPGGDCEVDGREESVSI